MFEPDFLFRDDMLNDSLRAWQQRVYENAHVSEIEYAKHIRDAFQLTNEQQVLLSERTCELITYIRKHTSYGDSLNAFLKEYSLDTQEGIILMCLAEALLRIPDRQTADALIKDKLSGADWAAHFKKSESALVNASTWGLILTGKLIFPNQHLEEHPASLLHRMVSKLGEPVVRSALYAAMKIMGKQFVLGRTIKEALKASESDWEKGYTHSYDMLGEAALTQADAQRYYDRYQQAILAIGQASEQYDLEHQLGISIKLSALHPRFEATQMKFMLPQLLEKVQLLLSQAREMNVAVSIDAEEMARLEITMALFEQLIGQPQLKGWGKLGLVVQAYSKRALPLLGWLTQLAKETGNQIPVRLVKGAYWDTEIKLAQQENLPDYPVFTRKVTTDLSYLLCMKYLLSKTAQQYLYPQFATHNAHTLVCLMQLGAGKKYELQRLHGMGAGLYEAARKFYPQLTCCIYAPVGEHKELLPYLVRRLLENGANNSFVHKLVDPQIPIEKLARHPLEKFDMYPTIRDARIPLPYQAIAGYTGAQGIDLSTHHDRAPLLAQLEKLETIQWEASSVIGGQPVMSSSIQQVASPQNRQQIIGQVKWFDLKNLQAVLDAACKGFKQWSVIPVLKRAQIIENFADLLVENKHKLVSLCIREAGKTIDDSLNEYYEAVAFCRYYAQQARQLMHEKKILSGYTGEENCLTLHPKGIFVCISPWNFPLAIFTGQVVAALVTGNAVIAKPAEQTGLIAKFVHQLALQSGIDAHAFTLILGDGPNIGAALVSQPDISGVCFTGSCASAHRIQCALAHRENSSLATLIAETGGQNTMIVDSTALPEQVVHDVISSAFQSAGQRCSALRVLCLQDEIADDILTLLQGAMQLLRVGCPLDFATDLGPVIDEDAYKMLADYLQMMKKQGQLRAQTPLNADTQQGYFIAPSLIEIEGIDALKQEYFGPVLHYLRFKRNNLESLLASINATGYGLTLGIHSRNRSFSQYIADHVHAGNVYINRNQIGAIVGAQPFGGRGLSGTGPKAGGPHYLQRFVWEKTQSNNTAAIGGNALLVSLTDDDVS